MTGRCPCLTEGWVSLRAAQLRMKGIYFPQMLLLREKTSFLLA